MKQKNFICKASVSMTYKGQTFLGYIPDGSNKQHLGIILGNDDLLLKYCYCTSQFTKIIRNVDFIEIPISTMKVYFSEPKRTFIFLSMKHIIDILIVTFTSRIDSEYDIMQPIGNEILTDILNKIRDSNNLPERFKSDFFSFIKTT